MAVRYDNDKNELLQRLENEQGSSFLPSEIYVHTDKKGFKRLYILNKCHRVFMFFEDPKFSVVGQWFGTFMLLVIVFNLVIFILSSIPQFKESPATCLFPVCNNDAALCPGIVVCEPEAMQWTSTVELVCVIIFTIEYLARIGLVWSVPPRLADILTKHRKPQLSMSSIFTNHEPTRKDELFAHIKLALLQNEQEAEVLVRRIRNKSVIFDAALVGLHDSDLRISPPTVSESQKTVLFDEKEHAFRVEDVPGELPSNGGDDSGILSRINVNFTEDGADIDDDFDDGFQLPNMNVPLGSEAGFGNLTDVEVKHHQHQQQQQHHHHHGHNSKHGGKGKRSNRHFKTKDALEDMDRKSLNMDNSHRYTGLYKTWAYAWKILNIIDVLAILPFYIELFVDSSSSNTSLSIVRVMRLARVFRIFKMGKGNSGVQMLGKTVYVSLPALSLLGFFIVLGVILFGSLVFFLEGGTYMVTEHYPQGAYLVTGFFGNLEETSYTSIIASIYWAVVTTTTTGYGDLVPLSLAGKVIACLCAYYGVLLLALPITVIGNNFDKILNAQAGRDNEQFVCECLTGILRSIDLEYRARSRLSPLPSTAYKSTLIAAVISAVDATKQTLIKDAILNANREQTHKRRCARARENAMLSRGRRISPRPANLGLTQNTSPLSDDAFSQPKDGAGGGGGGSNSPTRASSAVASLLKPAVGVKMTGIKWGYMPKMPERNDVLKRHDSLIHSESRKGGTPEEEIRLAKEELDAALREWTSLMEESSGKPN